MSRTCQWRRSERGLKLPGQAVEGAIREMAHLHIALNRRGIEDNRNRRVAEGRHQRTLLQAFETDRPGAAVGLASNTLLSAKLLEESHGFSPFERGLVVLSAVVI
jgi:hypothetical protein